MQIYLPLLLFLGFFFPNTRIAPLDETMIAGRWIVLTGIAGFVLIRWFLSKSFLYSHPQQGHLTALEVLFIISFFWLGISILESVNPPLSFAKWGVFLLFLLFCAAYSNLLQIREDLILALRPFIIFFVGFIWLIPISIQYFPQPLQSSLGFINGFLVFTNALGQFLASFGIPGVLFMLTYSLKRGMRIFLTITLFLAVFLTIYSGSRAGTFTSFFILSLALWRWRRDERFAFLKVTLFGVWILFLVMTPHIDEYFSHLLYKYPDESEILASRVGVWQRTMESFQERPLWGYGFGVQKQMADLEVGFFTIGYREQGSTYYGLLEEVGLVGALPIFLFFSIVGYKCCLSLWRSSDPLDLFFSRVIFTGLGLAAFENYLLALGNATSILVVLAFFLQERLKSMAGREILQRVSSPAQVFKKTSLAWRQDIP
jgi:O-antigen ligase